MLALRDLCGGGSGVWFHGEPRPAERVPEVDRRTGSEYMNGGLGLHEVESVESIYRAFINTHTHTHTHTHIIHL